MNFKVFIKDEEIKDEEIIIKLIKPLSIREDYDRIPSKINYVVKIIPYDFHNLCKVEYYTYNNILNHYKNVNKSDIIHILREYTLNKLLNE